jgi:hypothetical protein
MVAIEGVAFGLLLTAVGAGVALFPGHLSDWHTRVISTEPVQDASTADAMRTVLLKPIGWTMAGFGVFVAAIAFLN